jgi:hypothetical protein
LHGGAVAFTAQAIPVEVVWADLRDALTSAKVLVIDSLVSADLGLAHTRAKLDVEILSRWIAGGLTSWVAFAAASV